LVVGILTLGLTSLVTGFHHADGLLEVYGEAKRQILIYRESPKGFVMSVACECPPTNVYALMKLSKDICPLPSKA
jgi:hypothetical protein